MAADREEPLRERKCEWCDTSFSPRQKNQSFDRPACRIAFNNNRKAAPRKKRVIAAGSRCQRCGTSETRLYQTEVKDKIYVLCGQCRAPYQEPVVIEEAALHDVSNLAKCAEAWEKVLRRDGHPPCGVLVGMDKPFRGQRHESMSLEQWRGKSDEYFYKAGLGGDGGIEQLIDYRSGETCGLDYDGNPLPVPHPLDIDESEQTVYTSTSRDRVV